MRCEQRTRLRHAHESCLDAPSTPITTAGVCVVFASSSSFLRCSGAPRGFGLDVVILPACRRTRPRQRSRRRTLDMTEAVRAADSRYWSRIPLDQAEGEGFEPSIRLTMDNGFETTLEWLAHAVCAACVTFCATVGDSGDASSRRRSARAFATRHQAEGGAKGDVRRPRP